MIGLAKQEGHLVRVYDEQGHYKFEKLGTLQGFTTNTVVVRSGAYIDTFNDKGEYQFRKMT